MALLAQALIDHAKRLDSILSDALEDNQIGTVNLPMIAKRCRFEIHPNGDKVFWYLDKPLILLKPIELVNKEKDDCRIVEIVQKYKKLYEKNTGT